MPYTIYVTALTLRWITYRGDILNIYDIAKHADVSIATVSRVINDSPKVSRETREKVLEVMRENGFTPNSFARGLGLGTMGMAGILCTDASDMFYASALSQLERLLRKDGLNSILCCTGNELEDKKSALTLLLSKNVDAIFLVGSAFRERGDNSHIENAAKKAPVIVINGLVECDGVYCALCDELSAMRENVLRLDAAGCKNILYIYDAETYSGIQKLEGFNAGLTDLAGRGLRGKVMRCEKDVDDAQRLVFAAISGDSTIDGVLASEDLLAVGACKAMARAGKNVPVIGFNNSIFARCASPALSSVDNMVGSLCSSAVSILSELLNGRIPPKKMLVTARLVERETYGAGFNVKAD